MRLFGIEAFLEMLENYLDVIDMNQRAMLIQHLDEPTHMRSLEMVGQIDREGDGGNRVL